MHDEINRPLDVATAGTRHREHKRSLGLKKSTLDGLRGLSASAPGPVLRQHAAG